MKLCRIALLLLLASAFLTGCSRQDVRRHPLFVQGSKARAAGDGEAAKEYFEKLLKRRPDASAAMLELAGVCDELLNDQLLAAYYYRRYLEAVPDSPDAAAIAGWQANAEKKLFEEWKSRFTEAPAEKSSDAPPENAAKKTVSEASAESAEIAELRKQLALYQTRYTLIREEVIRLRKARSDAAAVAPAAVPATAATAPTRTIPEFYVVQSGDNPGKIAQKIYGDSRKYTLIMRANPQISEKTLKPGMKLVIPAP